MAYEDYKFLLGDVAIPVAAALAGAWFGVWYGGKLSRKASAEATAAAHKNALVLQQQDREAALDLQKANQEFAESLASREKMERINAVLDAIDQELSVTLEAFKSQGGDVLKSLKKDEPMEWFVSLQEKYFTVYASHSELIGQIADKELVRRIIVAYTKAKVFLDMLRTNNRFHDLREQWWQIHATGKFDLMSLAQRPDPIKWRLEGNVNKNMVELAPRLLKQYDDVAAAVLNFQMQLKVYRNPELAELDRAKIGGNAVFDLKPDQIVKPIGTSK